MSDWTTVEPTADRVITITTISQGPWYNPWYQASAWYGDRLVAQATWRGRSMALEALAVLLTEIAVSEETAALERRKREGK